MTESAWPRAILHVDMDAFFASVEQLDRPELRGKPVIVGGRAEDRGVVAAASYEARRFGVHSAMPMARAVRLCPQAIRVRGRMERYAEVSRAVFAVFQRFTPLVEGLSVDEAFLDITGSQRLFGPAPAIARSIKDAVRDATGLTASAGLAPTKFLAKIASDLEKPDGLVVIPADAVEARLHPLPIEKLWGVGARMAERLHRLGIHTVGDAAQWPQADLEERFGQAGAHLAHLSRGEDTRAVETVSETKSVSHEHTFAEDVEDADALVSVLRALADKVAARLRRKELEGRVVQIKVRYDDFSTVTRRQALPAPSALAATMIATGERLLRDRTEAGSRPVRLVGIGMAELTSAVGAVQSSLFDEAAHRRTDRLERAADAIRDRMGEQALRRGSQLERPDETPRPDDADPAGGPRPSRDGSQ